MSRPASRPTGSHPTGSRPTVSTAAALLTLAALCVALAWNSAQGGDWLDGPMMILPSIAALWLGNRGRTLLTAVACAGAALVLTVANQTAHPGDYSAANDTAFFLLLIGGPALLGALVGQRNRQIHELRRLTEVRSAMLESEVRAARLEEQSRIASRVQHDVIQAMGAIVLQAAGAAQAGDATRMREALSAIEGSARAALNQLRAHVGVLREPKDPPSAAAPARGQPAPPAPPRSSRRGARPSGAAVVVVLILCALLALECTIGGHARGPAAANVAGALLLALPVMVVRTRPLLAGSTFAIMAALFSHWLTPLPATVSALPLMLLVFFSLGERPDRRRDRVLGLAVAWAGTTLIWTATAGHPGVDDPAPGLVVATLAWLGGVVAGARTTRMRRLDLLLTDIARQQENAVRLATAEQRVAIARDLHDSVAAAMTVVCLHASGGQRQTPADSSALLLALQTIESTTRAGIAELRASLDVMDGEDPESLSLAGVLRDGRRAGITVDFVDETCTPLPPQTIRILARVAREALVNATRHAPGAEIEVRLESCGTGDTGRPDSVALEVTNPGADSSAAPGTAGVPERGTGHGLLGLRERLQLDGGTLEFGPTATGGFEVRATVPLKARVPA